MAGDDFHAMPQLLGHLALLFKIGFMMPFVNMLSHFTSFRFCKKFYLFI